MNARRWLVSLAIACVWLATPAPARAHRLDEYLQATRITINAERVGLEVDLTAGLEMASEAFAWIHTNRDGQSPRVEGAAYTRQVRRPGVVSVYGPTRRF